MAAHDWALAFDLFRAVGMEQLDARHLTMLGEAAWWLGRLDEAIDARQLAYRRLLESGEGEEAALVSLGLAEDHFHKLEPSLGRGWLRTAARLLDDGRRTRAQAQLRRFQTMFALEAEKDLDRALLLADETLELADSLLDKDLRSIALQDKGRILIALGQTEAGLALMEEAMVPAVSGELGPVVTGRMLCNMVETCERLGEYRRAYEWDHAARRWCDHLGDITGFPGICRVKRAEIYRFRGELELAAAEAAHATEELRDYRDLVAKAHGELGEIQRRRGDWEAAEASFAKAVDLGHDPQPGMALLRLDQGQAASAQSMLTDALRVAVLPLDRAPLLSALVGSALQVGQVDSAEAASRELGAIAESFRTSAWIAAAKTAEGMVALARGESQTAVDLLRSAFKGWSEADCPFEAAIARLALGQAYEQEGQSDRARVERTAAETALARVGAAGELAKIRPALSSRVAAMMLTDIVGSTSLLEAMGDKTWAKVLAWHDAVVTNTILLHGGRAQEHTGDGFFVEFDDSGQAVAAAVEIQRLLERQRQDHGFAPEVRIGIHAAEVLKEGAMLRGVGVHTAARIGAVAGPSEILVSRRVADGLADQSMLGEGREVVLKGLADPVEVIPVRWA